MSWTDLAWLKSLLLPPGVLLLVGLLGMSSRRRAVRRLAVAAIGLLAVLSLPITAQFLMTWVEGDGTEDGVAATGAPSAIIVLAGDYRSFAPEYGEATVGAMTLVRLRHGAYLHRRTGLPVVLSGSGTPPEHRPDLAEAMRVTMERDFGVPVRWVEGRSRNTFESAIETRRMLAADGVATAYLVTHAFHMRRSVQAFRAAGLAVVPAPTGGTKRLSDWRVEDFLPGAQSLAASGYAVHEAVGMIWYAAVIRLRTMTGR